MRIMLGLNNNKEPNLAHMEHRGKFFALRLRSFKHMNQTAELTPGMVKKNIHGLEIIHRIQRA